MMKFGYMLPRIDFRYLLEITGKMAGKKIVVASEDDLRWETSFVLPGPVSEKTALGAISAILLLEGFELHDAGDELQLRRVLTEQQVAKLKEGLEMAPSKKVEVLPLNRTSAGSKPHESWVTIRPELGNGKNNSEPIPATAK